MATLADVRTVGIALTTLLLVGTGCGSDGRTLRDPVFDLPATTTPTLPDQPAPLPAMQLIAPWPSGGAIPERHTCAGADVAPALSWVNVPPETVELALTATDPVAGGTVHWIVYAINPGQGGLAEGELPAGAYHWPNSLGIEGWRGPCPARGAETTYQFTLHALNQQLEVADDATATEVIEVLNATAIDQSSVAGTFVRDA